ncbi:MAG: hypothetical protein QM482_02160 [Sulfurospirillum sp.]
MNGTIIFYNTDNGTGLILSNEKQKYRFDIESWDDLDNLPQIGLKVSFVLEDGIAKSIKKQSKADTKTNNPIDIQDAKKTILQTSLPDENIESIDKKIDPDFYSIKTVPKNFINTTMNNFFSSLRDTVSKYKDYELQSGDERLDYFRIKRFLFTAYNNLLEIDSSLADGNLTEVYQNIQNINDIYNIYKKSYMYPKIAFSNIFLRYTRYKEAKKRLERNISAMKSLKASLSVMESEIKQKMAQLGELNKDDLELTTLKHNIKHLKSLYVDAIDYIGTLREENEMLLPITDEYFEHFFNEFSEKFESSYEKNIKSLIEILDSMAFLFDRLMWKKASYSKAIIARFEESNIPYPYSSLTFLRYYLKTLDKSKLNEENQELFNLLNYLENKK